MFIRQSATFAAREYDAEAIARIKQCRLWSHVEFIFRADRDLRGRLARIATALFRASEVAPGLTYCVGRVEDNGDRIAIHWCMPWVPPVWRELFDAAWFRAGGAGRPTHHSGFREQGSNA